ncbi:Mpo1-like protein [Fictibacillus terranigra]|uniref:Mpo1-like protein n=1 Tax=Fictibacillus terranigra TaxID=3058424 RepID=UPI00338FCE03
MHFFIEGNKPAAFGHPLWSSRADFKMFFFTLTGRLEQELKSCIKNSRLCSIISGEIRSSALPFCLKSND